MGRPVLVPLSVDRALIGRNCPAAAVHRLSGAAMGTTWSVALAMPADADLVPLRRGIEAELAEVVRQMSPWEADSCLSRFNRAPAGTWHELPPEFMEVLASALHVARASGGAFDPTVGALVGQWGFGPPGTAGDGTAPKWQALRIERQTRAACQPGGLRLDLCAIAKGFAVDRLAALLNGAGTENWLVEIGGELRGAGVKPDGTPWWVTLESPPADDIAPSPDPLVALHGVAVASSGGYRRAREHAGAQVTHLIDPTTGRPLSTTHISVSVVAGTCMLADAWATALAVLGPERGLALASGRGLAALFSVRESGGNRRTMTPAMAAMLT